MGCRRHDSRGERDHKLENSCEFTISHPLRCADRLGLPPTREEADMTGPTVKPGSAGTEIGGTAQGACAACPHAQNAHDAIARRYCTATVAGGFHRRCVCVGGYDEQMKEKS